MTIDEIFRRIVRAHLVLLLVCCALPVAAVLVMDASQDTQYAARVRLQVTSSAPVSTTEAEAISSRVLALATTPSLVQKVLDTNELTGDAKQIAAEEVTVDRLGESPVVQLAVRQEDPARATVIVRALAAEVATFMNQGSRDRFASVLTDTERRLADAVAQRREQATRLQEAIDPSVREELTIELESTQQIIEQLSQQRLSLLLADADRDHVVLVDADAPDVEVVPSGLLPRAALGLLLGLVLGLGLSVLVETLRPRIAGVRAVARSLDAPVLGKVTERSAALVDSMTVAARRQGVETLVLVGLDDRDAGAVHKLLKRVPRGPLPQPSASSELTLELASVEQKGGSGRNGKSSGPRRSPGPVAAASHRVRFTDAAGVAPDEEPTAGVVVVTSGTALQSHMDSFDDLRRARQWPVVGIVEVAHLRGRGGAS